MTITFKNIISEDTKYYDLNSDNEKGFIEDTLSNIVSSNLYNADEKTKTINQNAFDILSKFCDKRAVRILIKSTAILRKMTPALSKKARAVISYKAETIVEKMRDNLLHKDRPSFLLKKFIKDQGNSSGSTTVTLPSLSSVGPDTPSVTEIRSESLVTSSSSSSTLEAKTKVNASQYLLNMEEFKAIQDTVEDEDIQEDESTSESASTKESKSVQFEHTSQVKTFDPSRSLGDNDDQDDENVPKDGNENGSDEDDENVPKDGNENVTDEDVTRFLSDLPEKVRAFLQSFQSSMDDKSLSDNDKSSILGTKLIKFIFGDEIADTFPVFNELKSKVNDNVETMNKDKEDLIELRKYIDKKDSKNNLFSAYYNNFSDFYIAVFDDLDNNVTLANAILEQINDNKTSEDNLRTEIFNKIKSVIEEPLIGTAFSDKFGKYIEANPTSIIGYKDQLVEDIGAFIPKIIDIQKSYVNVSSWLKEQIIEMKTLITDYKDLKHLEHGHRVYRLVITTYLLCFAIGHDTTH